jgi:hypothetical protein
MNVLKSELENHFELLSQTSMKWDKETWADQVEEGRFEGNINFDHELIFWFDSYTSAYLGKTILDQMDEQHEVLFDTATQEWALTTTLLTSIWSS